jgi:hypothetical protein
VTYSTRPLFPILGSKIRWAVTVGNHTDVATFDTLQQAQRDAARRNYETDSYRIYRSDPLGL